MVHSRQKKQKKNTVWCFARFLLLVFCVCHGGFASNYYFSTRHTRGRKIKAAVGVLFQTHKKQFHVFTAFLDDGEASGGVVGTAAPPSASVSGLFGFGSAQPTREALIRLREKCCFERRQQARRRCYAPSRFSNGARHYKGAAPEVFFCCCFSLPPCQLPTVVTRGLGF